MDREDIEGVKDELAAPCHPPIYPTREYFTSRQVSSCLLLDSNYGCIFIVLMYWCIVYVSHNRSGAECIISMILYSNYGCIFIVLASCNTHYVSARDACHVCGVLLDSFLLWLVVVVASLTSWAPVLE